MWKQRFVLRDKEGAAEGGAGGGGEVSADMQALIDKAVGEAVSGLKSKNQELLGKLKEQTETLKRYDGIDPDAVTQIIKRFADDEEAGLIKAGKLDEVLSKRTEKMKAGFEKETAAERKLREAAEARAKKFTDKVLENHIRAEASAAGLHKHAVDDALLRARSAFALDDDGNAIPADDVYGKDGKPLTLKEWFTDMKERAPHWWPATQGGGASGATGDKNSKTVSRKTFDAMSPAERMTFSKGGGKVTD